MTTQQPDEQPPPPNAERILVVDDEGEYLKRVCRSLARGGFVTVLIANDVATAERLVQKHRPRLALIDLDLGEFKQNGFAFLKTIRSEYRSTLPVILSGDRSPQQLFRAARDGAVEYLVKGPSLDLPREVTRILAGERGATMGRPLPHVVSDLGYLSHLGLTQLEIRIVTDLVRGSRADEISDCEPAPTERALQLVCAKLGVETTQQLVRALAVCELFRQENRIGGR